MGAAKKAIRIFESEAQPVRIDELKIVETALQSRAETDPEIVAIYAERRRGKPKQPGTPFPPVLVFIIDSVWWLVDGFHRVAAAIKLGEETIPAIVRHGTMLDALLAGAAINMSKENLRGYQEDDRRRFAELLIRCGTGKTGEGSWDWSDTEITRRSGLSGGTIAKMRAKLFHQEGIPIPNKVKQFRRTGGESGRFVNYRKNPNNPVISPIPSDTARPAGYKASVNNKKVYLGTDRLLAESRLNNLIEDRTTTRKFLKKTQTFSNWLMYKGLISHSLGMQESVVGGLKIKDAILFPLDEVDYDSVLQVIGKTLVAKRQVRDISRCVLVGYFGTVLGHVSQVIAVARQHPDPIEFMTPEEVVAAFGGTPDPSDSIDADDGPDAEGANP